MNTFMKGAAALSFAALTATGASAATVTSSEMAGGMQTASGTVNAAGDAISFQFKFDRATRNDGPVTGVVSFSADRPFDFFFTSYFPADNGSDVSGYFLRGPGGSYLTSQQARACDNATFTGNDDAEKAALRCNFVTGVNGDTSRTVIKPDSDSAVFTSLLAGDYLLGFYDNRSPLSGTASFRMEETLSAVPVPASALLLGTALLGAGAMTRRRRKAA